MVCFKWYYISLSTSIQFTFNVICVTSRCDCQIYQRLCLFMGRSMNVAIKVQIFINIWQFCDGMNLSEWSWYCGNFSIFWVAYTFPVHSLTACYTCWILGWAWFSAVSFIFSTVLTLRRNIPPFVCYFLIDWHNYRRFHSHLAYMSVVYYACAILKLLFGLT